MVGKSRKLLELEPHHQEQLERFVLRIERLEEEKGDLGTSVRQIYDEAKRAGFNPKVMRQIVRQRKRDPDEVEEEETLLDLYCKALGMR